MEPTHTTTPNVAIDALKRIREMGYNSQAARATDTVLACIRVAEDPPPMCSPNWPPAPPPSPPGHMFRCCALVHKAEAALGRTLSNGEVVDLLLDHFDWLPGVAEARELAALSLPDRFAVAQPATELARIAAEEPAIADVFAELAARQFHPVPHRNAAKEPAVAELLKTVRAAFHPELRSLEFGMLIAEDEEGHYEPIDLASTEAEAREMAAMDLNRRGRLLINGEEPGLCPYQYTIWGRDENGRRCVVLTIDLNGTAAGQEGIHGKQRDDVAGRLAEQTADRLARRQD